MKSIKKVFAIILVMVMVLACGAIAFAADTEEPETYSITISNTEAGHTYTAYQIFEGELSDSTLSDIKWGSGINGADLLTALKADTVFGTGTGNDFSSCTSAADAAAIIGAENYAAAKVEEFAKKALANKKGTGVSDDDSDENGDKTSAYIIEGLTAGYYLVTDEIENESVDMAESALILKVVKDQTVSPKSNSNPTFDKVIGTNALGVADKNVGDEIEFTLKATLPASTTLSKYTSYKLNFNDTLDAGLSFVSNSVKVYKDSTEITTATGVDIDTDTAQTIKVSISDVKAAGIGATGGEVIKVVYKAELNSSAVKTGTQNTAYIEYSHDPNNSSEYSKLPEKKVTVWTFDFTLTKEFSDGQNHTAGFTLYKDEAKPGNEIGTEKEITTNNGTAVWNDLADGDYVLVETSIPDGFNSVEDIVFTITTTVDENGNRTRLLSSNSAVSTDYSTGDVTTKVVNNSGSILPSTGGIGTTIFYIVGSLLVIGALIFLISKRRMAEKA